MKKKPLQDSVSPWPPRPWPCMSTSFNKKDWALKSHQAMRRRITKPGLSNRVVYEQSLATCSASVGCPNSTNSEWFSSGARVHTALPNPGCECNMKPPPHVALVSLVRSGGSDDSGDSGGRRGLEVIGQIWGGTHLINQQNGYSCKLICKVAPRAMAVFPHSHIVNHLVSVSFYRLF